MKLENYISLIKKIKLNIFIYNWKKNNKSNGKYNYTTPVCIFPEESVIVGDYSYGPLYVNTFDSNSKLIIGRFCCIASEVQFLVGGEHKYKNISTYMFKKKFLNENEGFSKGDIIISDDVWIGYRSTILSGVKIGQGAIIGAGSVVAKDVPPYAIYCGGKVVKYRFSEDIIKKLLHIDYSKIDKKFVLNNIDLFYDNEIQENNVDKILDKFPKK